jgi:hypothetical protein
MLVSGTFFELLQPFEFFTFSQNGEKKTFRRKKGRKKERRKKETKEREREVF